MRLLFVENDPVDYEDFGEALEEEFGWEVVHVKWLTQALATLEKDPLFDVIIIDLKLPKTEGGEESVDVGDQLLATVAYQWAHICPIILTNNPSANSAFEAGRRGAWAYFYKSVDLRELDKACRKGVQAQRFKRLHYALQGFANVDEILREVRTRISDILDPAGLKVAYFETTSAGLLLRGNSSGQSEYLPIVEPSQNDKHMLAIPCVAEVVASANYQLLNTLDVKAGCLSNKSQSQLIVPIRRLPDEHISGTSNVEAVLWIESTEKNAFEADDARMFMDLADFIGAAYRRTKYHQLQTSQSQLSERQGLLSEISHRICNPLQISQSTIDLIIAQMNRGDTIDSAKLKESLSSALEGLLQATKSAQEIRSGREPRLLTLKPVCPSAILRDIVKAFKPQAEMEHVTMKLNVQSEAAARMDVDEFRYALNCILQNAIEAIASKRLRDGEQIRPGTITVTLETDDPATQILICVSDNGCGIPPEDLSRVFDRYYSTKHRDYSRVGQGLGLWEAKRFIERIGGSIRALSAKANGVTIRIVLPVCEKNAEIKEITV